MRLVLRRLGRIAVRLLLALCALGVAEFIGVAVAFSGGLVLVPIAPFLIGAGLPAGAAALVVGVVRRRRDAPAGGIGGFDLLLHAVLLANTAVFAAAIALQRTPQVGGAEWVLGGVIAAGSFALVGVPLSVWASWTRAFTPAPDAPSRLHVWVLRVSHAASIALAGAVLLTCTGPTGMMLLGSAGD